MTSPKGRVWTGRGEGGSLNTLEKEFSDWAKKKKGGRASGICGMKEKTVMETGRERKEPLPAEKQRKKGGNDGR